MAGDRGGIVEPGREHEALCDQITEGLMSFKDADTGEPVISQIGRGDKLYPDEERFMAKRRIM